MKRILFIMIIAILGNTPLLAQNWVVLTRTMPASPEITVIQSNNQQVSFTVGLPGFYSTQISENGINYQRLSIPNYGTAGATGEPEIPVITKRIAVPACAQINYLVQITGSDTLQGYIVYPIPELQPDSSGMLNEIFYINPSAYQQNAFTPAESYLLLETGALRAQNYITLEIHPMSYNPATGELIVATEMEITLTFDNPTTDVNVNTGIFNGIATHSFLNYQDSGIKASVNDKAYTKDGFVKGSVNWVTLTDTAQACNIVCDYLIITDATYFTPNDPNSELARLANHRAYYNGYDVAILNVVNIVNLPFFLKDHQNTG